MQDIQPRLCPGVFVTRGRERHPEISRGHDPPHPAQPATTASVIVGNSEDRRHAIGQPMERPQTDCSSVSPTEGRNQRLARVGGVRLTHDLLLAEISVLDPDDGVR